MRHERREWSCRRSGAAPCSAKVTHFALRQSRLQVLAATQKRFTRGSRKLHENRNAARQKRKRRAKQEAPEMQKPKAAREKLRPKRKSPNVAREQKRQNAKAPTRNIGEEDKSINGKATKPSGSVTLRASAERPTHPPLKAPGPTLR